MRGPLLTSCRLFNCEYFFFCSDVIVHFLSLEDSGQKWICCFCLFCSGLVIIYLFFFLKKKSYLTLSGPSLPAVKAYLSFPMSMIMVFTGLL